VQAGSKDADGAKTKSCENEKTTSMFISGQLSMEKTDECNRHQASVHWR